ncbi:MAG: HDOD domain-containing protein [Terriglobia bacterium]
MIEAVMIGKAQECFFPYAVEQDLSASLGALRAEAGLAGLPPAVERINRLLSSAPVDLRSLGESVKEAPGLAEEAVKLCNASLFELSQPVASVEQAVIIMGADIVRTLILTCWLTRYTGENIPGQDSRAFWGHSLLVAKLSQHMCQWAGFAQPEWAFLAGLFHDLGAVPFLTLLARDRGRARQGLFEIVGDSVEAQRRRFDTDHCELGLQIGINLGLSAPLVEVMARHHQRGGMLSSMPLLAFVCAAEAIAQDTKPGEASLPQAQLVRNALAEFMPGLTPQAGPGLIETLEADLRASAEVVEEATDALPEVPQDAPTPARQED